jgi:hypothetical protein
MPVARSVATLAVFLLAASSSNGQAPLTRDRASLARPILLHAEASSRATGPAARAFLLYRTAGAWLDVDLAHAVEVYRKAFAGARLIDSTPLKDAIEHDILSDLLPLSPTAALELIPQADAKTQEKMYTAAVHFLLLEHDVHGAVKAFEQASAADIFSERAATHLLAVANPADRDLIFRSAMAACGAQKPEESHSWTASKLVARTGRAFLLRRCFRGSILCSNKLRRRTNKSLWVPAVSVTEGTRSLIVRAAISSCLLLRCP